MSWWETLHLVTWWKRLGISAIKTGQDAPSWIWCTETLSFFGGGHIVLQRFVHVRCHFQPLPTKLVFAYFDRGSCIDVSTTLCTYQASHTLAPQATTRGHNSEAPRSFCPLRDLSSSEVFWKHSMRQLCFSLFQVCLKYAWPTFSEKNKKPHRFAGGCNISEIKRRLLDLSQNINQTHPLK